MPTSACLSVVLKKTCPASKLESGHVSGGNLILFAAIRLEDDLEAPLELSGAVGCSGNLAKGTVGEFTVRGAEVWMVKHVEGFDSSVDLQAFVDGPVTADLCIEIHLGRAVELVLADVSEERQSACGRCNRGL